MRGYAFGIFVVYFNSLYGEFNNLVHYDISKFLGCAGNRCMCLGMPLKGNGKKERDNGKDRGGKAVSFRVENNLSGAYSGGRRC